MTTATATRTRQPATKHPRSATIFPLNNGKPVLCLTVGGAQQAYLLAPIPSDFGTAFHLTKAIGGDGQGGEEYDVLLNGKESSCTCPGHTYRSKCKHLDALQALAKSGKLPVAAKPQPRPEPRPAREPGIDDEEIELTEEPPQPRPEPQPAKVKRCFECGRPCDDFYCALHNWL